MEFLGTKPFVKRSVRSILISQPKPTSDKSPYFDIAKKHGIQVDFRSFIHIEGVTAKDFRKEKINPLDYSVIIFTSRNAITHFFRICEDLKIKMPQDMRYLCSSEVVALYLQNFIQYRKRKVTFGDGKMPRLKELLKKYKKGEKFLYPCSDVAKKDIQELLQESNLEYAKATILRTVCSDLSDLENIFYDMIVFFSPSGLKSLYENFPQFTQNNTRLAAWGDSTCQSVEEHGLRLDVKAPVNGAVSMTAAIDQYVELVNNIEEEL